MYVLGRYPGLTTDIFQVIDFGLRRHDIAEADQIPVRPGDTIGWYETFDGQEIVSNSS